MNMTVLLWTLPWALLWATPNPSSNQDAVTQSPAEGTVPLVDYGARGQDDGRQDDGGSPGGAPLPPGVRNPVVELVPGVLPEASSPEARALWELLIEATRVPNVSREAIESFVMEFDGTVYPRNGQRNRFRGAKYSYLAPRSIISDIPGSSRLIRGAEGDWLKTDDDELVSLNDRTAAQDRKQLDDTLAIARNLVNLLDPGSLRIEAIGVIARPPALVPKDIRAAHPNVEWLHMTSPDLRLSSAMGPANPRVPRKSRAYLGLDPETHLPSLAVVYEEVEGKADLSNARFLVLGRYGARSGYRIPTRIHVHGPDQSRPAILAFRAKPELELVMTDINLRAALTDGDFLPN